MANSGIKMAKKLAVNLVKHNRFSTAINVLPNELDSPEIHKQFDESIG